MKVKFLFSIGVLLFICVLSSAEPQSFKQFIVGTGCHPGGNYHFSLCHEGDQLDFLVYFADEPSPGKFTPQIDVLPASMKVFQPRVDIAAASSRHPKATFVEAPKTQVDLFAAPEQLYQTDRGSVRVYSERITFAEWKAFEATNPSTHTIDALLAYVDGLRARAK